jgi:tetratricopeptide (TPR) repeat protein
MNGGSDLFDAAKSFREPSYAVASNVYDGTDGLLLEMASIPRAGQADALLDRFAAGATSLDDLLDWIDPDRVAAGLEERNAAAAVADLDLFLASHRTTSRAGNVDADHFPVGVERRGYVLEHRASEGGAISGVLDVRPAWRSGEIVIDLRLRQVAQYSGTLISDPNPASWPHHRYVANGGRALVSAVRLVGTQGSTEAVPTGDTSDGWMGYTVPWTEPDLRGAMVDVELRFFDLELHLAVDLFASDAARRLRRLDGRIAATGDAESADAALVLWERGRRAEAMRRFESLVDTGDLDALPAIFEVVTASRRHDVAAALTERILAREPDRSDLWLRLGFHLCAAGDHDGAGVAFDEAMARDGADVTTIAWWGAGAAWLDGDPDRALLLLRLVPNAARRDRVLPLRYAMAVVEKRPGAGALRELVRDERDEQPDATTRSLLGVLAGDERLEEIDRSGWTEGDLCRGSWYAACHAIATGRRGDALGHLREAVATGAEGMLELHLAREVITRMEAAP